VLIQPHFHISLIHPSVTLSIWVCYLHYNYQQLLYFVFLNIQPFHQ